MERESLGMQEAKVERARLVTVRDLKFTPESAPPRKPQVFLYVVTHKNAFKLFSSVWSDFLGAKFDACMLFG